VIAKPLMQKIVELRSNPRKEATGFQLVCTFIEHQVQPLVARAHCMWEYSGRIDSTRLSVDELKEIDLDDKVHALTSLL
jgi:hypothetical protein